MSFGSSKREKIRERSGYHCQICGEWHPEGGLAAHSLDRTHKDSGIAVCIPRDKNGCHQRLHDTTSNPDQLRRVSLDAVSLNSLGVTVNMEKAGVPEKKIRRVLRRICSI